MSFEAALKRNPWCRCDRQCELPSHSARSCLEAVNGIHYRLKLALYEHVDGTASAQLRIPSVNPYLDALGAVHVSQFPHDVMNIDKPISGLGCGAGATCCPILDLAFSHPSDLANLSRGQPALPDLLNKGREGKARSH